MTSFFVGRGHVFHGRQELKKNSFRYGNFFIYFPVSEFKALQQLLHRRFRFFLSFRVRNYLDGDHENLDHAVRAFLLKHCQFVPESVWLQTMPSIFSYVFNPVSFWWCYRAGILEAVLCEVNNTFGERHFYWVYQGGKDISNSWITMAKEFHVSPFFPVRGRYDFRFKPPEASHLQVQLNYFNSEGHLALATMQEGKLTDLTKVTRWELLRQYSWMTVFVVYRIHYQAFRLWLKKIPFYSKPEPPTKKVSL